MAGRIGKAIEGLTQDPIFLRLKAQSRLGALKGKTKARGESVTRAGEQLWTLYLSLDKQLAEAAELRRSNNPFNRDERFAKIDQILTGPCVSMPSEAIGLAELSLTGGPDRIVSLKEVFEAMQAAFNASREIVLAAGREWANASELTALRNKIKRLEEDIRTLGAARPPALDEALKRIESFSQTCDADPIGAADARAEIEALVGKADEALASARQDQEEAKQFLALAEARLIDLTAMASRVGAQRADRLAKISDPPPTTAIPEDPTEELRTWFARLARTAAQGRHRATLIGGKSWLTQADQALSTFQAIEAEDKRLLDARDDLRGRFSALTAKAQVRASEGRLSAEAAALFKQTQALLFGASSPLPEAVSLLKRCENI